MKKLGSQSGHGHLLVLAALVVGIVGVVGFKVASNPQLASSTTAAASNSKMTAAQKKHVKKINAQVKALKKATTKAKTYAKQHAAANKANVVAMNTAAKAPAQQTIKPSIIKNPTYAATAHLPKVPSGTAANVSANAPVQLKNAATKLKKAIVTYKAAADTTKQVNLYVYTWVQASDGTMTRLGGVQMKVVRDDIGKKHCDGIHSQLYKTKKSKDQLSNGSIQYLDCGVGNYTASVAGGLKGYTLLSKNATQKVSLPNDNKSAIFNFVFKKDGDTTKPDTSTAPADAVDPPESADGSDLIGDQDTIDSGDDTSSIDDDGNMSTPTDDGTDGDSTSSSSSDGSGDGTSSASTQ